MTEQQTARETSPSDPAAGRAAVASSGDTAAVASPAAGTPAVASSGDTAASGPGAAPSNALRDGFRYDYDDDSDFYEGT